jgi:hypothetical protein
LPSCFAIPPKRMNETAYLIQLTPNDDPVAVRDRLAFFRGQRVLLVWPEEGTVLRRKLDLVLVQREAMRRAIRLALVSHDLLVAQHAAELNISVFSTVSESERHRWKRGRSKVFTNRYQRPADEPDPDELRSVASRVSADALPRRGNWLITSILVLAVLGGLYGVVPSATIRITPAQTEVENTVDITASPNIADINVEQGIIPMTRLRVEAVQTGTLETTGTIPLNSTRALGQVIFINRTVSAVEIPEGTGVTTSAGSPIEFRTLIAVTVPAGAGAQIEAPIEALQAYAGAVGNVEAGLINTVNGALSGVVDVINTIPTNGGTSDVLQAVTDQDLERLEAMVRQQIQAQAYNEMEPLLNESQFIVLETIRIAEERADWKTFSAQLGEPTDTLTLTMRAIVEAVAVDEQFGQQVAFANLSQQVPRGRLIVPESLRYVRGTVSQMSTEGTINFSMTANATIQESVNVPQLQHELAARPLDQAFSHLTTTVDMQQNTVPEVRLFPAWLPHMPLLPARIEIELQEATPS